MTTQERKVQLGVGVDATGAKAGFDQVKAGAKDMAQAVAAAGKEGAKGLDGIGAGGEKAAEKVEVVARKMAQSIQRATAVMQAGEAGTAKYFETLGGLRGADANALKPYLDQLRQAEAAQSAASGSLGKMEMSAKQTTAALRQVPAQFTDIIVSLQSGQAPLTVLLQQGGQLKDVFGGIGPAARALGGYVAGLVNPFTLAAAAVGVLSYGYLAGAKESENHTRALIQSGNAAGTTAGQMQAAAQRIGALVGTQGQAAAALDAMAQSGAVGATNLERFTAAAIQFERVTGTAVDDTVKSFAELKKAPLEASLKLNESMNYLTASLYNQIKALDEQGRSTEAADLAQKAFADTLSNRAGEMEKQLGVVERSWRNIKDAVLGAGSAILSIGRTATPQDQLTTVQSDRSALERAAANSGDPQRASRLQNRIESLKVIEASLQEQIRLESRSAGITAEKASLVKLLAGYEKEQDQYKTKSQRRDEEIQRAQIEGARLVAAGLRDQKQVEQDIANIREKYADKAVKTKGGDPFATDRAAAQEWAQYYEAFAELTDKATGKTDGLSAAQLKLQQYLVSPAYANATESMRQLVLQQAYGAVSAENLAKAQAALAKAQAEVENTRDAELKRAGADVVALEARAQALEDEVLAYGLGKEAVEAMTIARLEERKAMLQQFDGSEDQIKLLEQEIAARKRLAQAQDNLAGKEAAERASKKAIEETQRAGERIDDLIANSLMRGFERGMDYAETAVTTLENLFKTLVLRPTISFFTQPFSAAIAGMGGSSAAFAGQGGAGGDAVGSVFQAKSLYDTFAGGFNTLGQSFTTMAASMGKWLVQNTTGVLQQAGSKLYAYSGTIGTVGANLGGAAVGYGIGTAISGGRSVFGDGNQDVATVGGTAIGAAIGSVVPVLGTALGAALGGSIGGIINRAFGQGAKEINASGIAGTFSGDMFSGQSFREWSRAGGWFSSGSSGTDYSALDGGTASNLGKVYATITSSTAELAAALGLPTSQILGYVKSIRLDASQLNEAGINSLFNGIADELASTVVGPAYIRQSERASVALTRMVTSLAAVNGAFDVLDKTLLSASLVGGDSASQLVDLLGGIESFNTTTLSYYETFYTEAERNAKTTEQLVAQFAGLGVALPDSLQAYRDLVNAQDITTESGRNTYAALMGLSGAFATVTGAASKAVSDLIKTSDFATYIDYASAASKAGGTPLPRFAGGGDHFGGLRVVGEKGWEVEATGAARIWNQQQLGAALGSGGAATAEEVAALREEQRAQAAAMVSRLADLFDIVKKWEGIGMPKVRTT